MQNSSYGIWIINLIVISNCILQIQISISTSKQASGNHPSLALNDNGDFIMAYAADGGVKYLFGHATQDGIKFHQKGVTLIRSGSRPSVALNNHGQLVLTYEHDDSIYYVTGLYKDTTVTFNNPSKLTTGNNSNITLNNAGFILEIHETSNMHLRKNSEGKAMLYTMIHYRYGALKVNNGTVDPNIDFSTFVELSSGVTPDIALNNNGDVVQIHERPMRDDLGDFAGLSNLDEYLWDIVTNDDNGLRYRSVKSMTQPQLVTGLSDLPANESGYILIKKGNSSWEAPKGKYKIYVVISQVRDKIEIEYSFFYPTNGTNLLGTELLHHVGDWERIYVFLDANSNLVEARYNYHSYSKTFSKSELEFADSTHPIVHVAQETHASYPKISFALKECPTDIVLPGGTKWNSTNNMEVVKIYGQILNGNEWIHWRGAWGSSLNSPISNMWR